VSSQRRPRAQFQLPSWFWGNDAPGFAAKAHLHFHLLDRPSSRWEAETTERYEHRDPRLFQVTTVASATGKPSWAFLDRLPKFGLTHTLTADMLAAEKRRLLDRPGKTFTQAAAWVHLVTVAAPEEDLVEVVRESYESLSGMTVEGGVPAFPGIAAHFIAVDEALAYRSVFTRLLLQVEEDPGLLTKKPKQTGPKSVFGSGWHLQSDLTLTRDAYVGPLFLCLTPWVWAVIGARLPGVVVYDLGASITGRAGEGPELLQQFVPSGLPANPPRPMISPNETLATLSWWVEHIDSLMSDVTDPSNYLDRNASYRPRRQFEVLSSIEQLGRRITSILANDRDLDARRLGAFAALDTLDGLGVVSFEQACKLSRAEKALQKLVTILPDPVAKMLLPTARRAVEGLRECQQGFFMQSRVGVTGVLVPDKRGGSQTLSHEEAVAAYLRVLRNANHGFTGENDAGRRRDQILLMAHDGDVPDGVALLPYLYWLELLADPTVLVGKLPPPG
jgi:hypothetical protein